MAGHFSSLVAVPEGHAGRVPVSVLTGFLGSGKTTLLNRLLGSQDLTGTAVIVNEFGEVGIDQDLIAQTSEQTLLLANGCLCCAMRGDLIEALERLRSRMASTLSRVVIETSGLADPGPILRTLTADPAVTRHFRLATVACTVDGILGVSTLDAFKEAQEQLAVADQVFVTKLDTLGGRMPDALACRLAAGATQARVHLEAGEFRGLLDELTRGRPSAEDDCPEGPLYRIESRERSADARHTSAVRSGVIRRDEALLKALQAWLDLLIASRGDDLLRLKGIVAIREHPDQPLVIHGVQHLFAPPERRSAWPTSSRQTRIVVIGRDLNIDVLSHTLDVLASRHRRSETAA